MCAQGFYDTKPYKVGARADPNTGNLVYYVVSVEETPPAILYLAGDAIQNLRSALDHLAFQLWEAGIYCPGVPARHVFSPIFDGPTEYKTGFQRAVKRSRKEVIDALGVIEPYKGGKGHRPWMLHKLNTIDKHRELLTAGAAFRSINIGAGFCGGRRGAEMAEFLSRAAGRKVVLPILDFYLKPAYRVCPLEAGDPLFIDAPDTEVNEKMDFRFEVALSEPQVVEGDPLLETIHQIAQLVDQIIVPFGLLL